MPAPQLSTRVVATFVSGHTPSSPHVGIGTTPQRAAPARTAVRHVHVGPHAVPVAVRRHAALEVLAARHLHVLQTVRRGEPAHRWAPQAL